MPALRGAESRSRAATRSATRSAIRSAIAAATRTLAAAGIASPRVDAEELAAHAAGVERSRLLLLDDPGDGFDQRYRELVAARARRVPLQHLTGSAPFGPLQLRVGPGVFIPRPETESLWEWTVAAVERRGAPEPMTIVDLCTGSAALAVGLARRFPHAVVYGIDDSPAALEYARANAEGTGVRLVQADVTDTVTDTVTATVTATSLLPELDGTVDVVVSNPPYIPDGAELDTEVADHDPHHALFGGPDGMAVLGPVIGHAARWLRAGGLLAVEHDDSTAAPTMALVAATGAFEDIESRTDLAGRPRFVTAVRNRTGNPTREGAGHA